ncbi:divisome protein SepX/GlpR [Corynebacterium stercoris]
MGSPSLIILLIIVVWIIVLAPLVLGNNKPIRRSGEGYEETRVLLEGGTAPVATRRRPKLTAADVHRHNTASDEDYEVVEAVAEEEQVLIDDTNGALRPLFPKRAGSSRVAVIEQPVVEAEAEEPADAAAAEETETSGGSTAYSVLKAEAGSTVYEVDEAYLAPSDFGYEAEAEPDAEAELEDEVELEAETEEDAEDAEDTEVVEATEDDQAYAETRKGRGGWDPKRDELIRADRQKRRQRTFLGLIIACVITLVAATVAGGWVWVLPAISIALTVWFMVALRRVVKQERALRARRMRQLRRARLGVDTVERPAPAAGERRRAGSVILNLDDESPDFDHLPRYRQPEPDHGRFREDRVA